MFFLQVKQTQLECFNSVKLPYLSLDDILIILESIASPRAFLMSLSVILFTFLLPPYLPLEADYRRYLNAVIMKYDDILELI